MRCQRVAASIMVCSSMWPMCSDPVTLGGGMTMEKRAPGAVGSAWKMPVSTHHRDQCGSNCCGSYAFSNCMGKYYFNREAGDEDLGTSVPALAVPCRGGDRSA